MLAMANKRVITNILVDNIFERTRLQNIVDVK